MTHANAALTPKHRLRLARAVVEDGWTPAYAAAVFNVSAPTARKWATRYAQGGPAAMGDRSSRPHRSPRRTPAPVVRKIVHLRWKKRLGPVQIAGRLGLTASTVHAVLVRCRLNRLSHIDRATGEPIRRYEHDRPGSLIHVDVKKLGNIPDGGGWRYTGRAQGHRNRAATPGKPKNKHYNATMGTAFVHTVIDDHSRVAYAEIHDDETATTAITVLRNATAWFAARGITVQRVLSDNGSAYRSHAWRDACLELGITPKRTRPYRPQTNGKIERFHRTLADGWAYGRMFTSETARRKALPAWLHEYNHHRPHTATGNLPPITRLNNLSGQYSGCGVQGRCPEVGAVPTGPIFTSSRGPHRYGDQVVYEQLDRLCRAADLPAGVTPHSLQTSYATEALRLGAALQDVQDALGHADPRTTRRYDRRRDNHDSSPSYVLAAALSSDV